MNRLGLAFVLMAAAFGKEPAPAGAAGDCAPTRCDSPPPSSCSDAFTLEIYESPGTCSSGVCGYRVRSVVCLGGCSAGACAGEPT